MKVASVLPVLQAMLGFALAGRPDFAARAAAGDGRPPPAWVVRVLGLRMVAQGMLVGAARWRRRDLHSVLRIGATVDAAHAASMVGAAAWKPAYRRSALVSGGIAAASAAAGLAAARKVASVSARSSVDASRQRVAGRVAADDVAAGDVAAGEVAAGEVVA